MMIPGISGSLLSHDVLSDVMPHALRGLLGEGAREHARARLRSWHHSLAASLGPSVAARGLFDRVAEPLMTALGYDVTPVESTHDRLRAVLGSHGATRAMLLVTSWGVSASHAWRDAVRLGIGGGARWCFCLTGARLRIVDAARTYSRQYVDIDLEATLEHEPSFAVLWGLLRSEAMAGSPGDATPLIERAIALTEAHRASVRACLQHGVHDALTDLSGALAVAARRQTRRGSGPTRGSAVSAFDEALTVVYRVLFLLFAEARGLVPTWHPTYRDGYTIESLRADVERQPRPVGIWESLQAIARLAHHGCRIGALRVPPFNGRLFSPSQAPLADRVPLDDAVVRRALLALTTRRGRSGRERIAYTDLGVEQLGSVYERLLDFDPAGAAPAPSSTLVRTERRKSTGAFYTPRPVTEYLVRRTLAPLVEHATPDNILRLRVLDPAMGSGAFLVAACRYLASAYEAALLREGGWSADDITEHDRVMFRRTIAQRCLYGVDINPMAVQLGRLSLWLATLSSDRPLTFLDHRLRTGNSLVGASLHDVARQAPGGRHRHGVSPLPLFDGDACDAAVRQAIAVRARIALEPGDTLEQVRAKERAFSELTSGRSAVERWKVVCDCWCGAWFGDRRPGTPVPFTTLVDQVLGRGQLPDHLAAPVVAASQAVAARERFFHWPLEFPEVFSPEATRERDAAGFDAIVGNPPWEMLRGDRGDAATRGAARTAAARLTDFARGSGIYPLQANGHANLYQLFLERSLALVRNGGRLGLVLPSGLASDTGAAGLRRALLGRTGIDSLVSLDNRDAIFPVHRSLRILLLTATAGERTPTLPCRFGIRDRETLDRLPESGPDPAAVLLPRALLDTLSRDELVIPSVASAEDLDILHAITFSVPALGDREGWHVRFGRELNATDDRHHLHQRREGLPVLEGKHLLPFTVDVAAARLRIDRDVAATVVDPASTFARRRLGYREVASATNRLTLIAAVLPAGTITTHTVFCLKSDLDDDGQDYLCGMLNSFVANYLVRMRVGTHVTSGIIDRLPVPVLRRHDPRFREIAEISRSIAAAARAGTAHAVDGGARARLQALGAHVYALRPSHFRHILATFPLVPSNEREAAMTAFYAIVS